MGDASVQNTTIGSGRVHDLEAEFLELRRTDRLGNAIHGAVAAVTCFLVAGPMTVSQLSLLPLAVCFGIRVTGMHAIVRRLGQTLLGKLLMAWAGWSLLSILWSVDPWQGVDELSDLRWVLMPMLLWAALDRRQWFVGALAAGLLVAIVYLGVRAGWPDATGGPARWGPDRYSGWWHPVVGGSILTAALGLHLPAALLGRGPARAAGVLGAALAAAAVLATGSRGAWLASAALVGVTAVWAVAGSARMRRSAQEGRGARAWLRVLGAAGAAAVVVGVAVIGSGLGGVIERRFERGVAEIRGAMERKDFSTDTGARMLMAWWALEAIAERPVQGIGHGGYGAWVRQHLTRQGIDPQTRNVHEHAHNAALHIGATQGLIGLGLAAAIIVVVLGAELRRARALRTRLQWERAGDGDGEREGPSEVGLGAWAVYDMGPACALTGMVLVSLFDTVHLNAQTAAVLWVLIGLCPPGRPEPVGLLGHEPDRA